MKADFYIYGEGPLWSELIALSRDLQVENSVHFEGHCDDISRRLKNLDVLLMTSDHEGLPMILLEAMALKVPIIAHGVGGITELLDGGACGILVSNHNAAGYAESIQQLYKSQNQSHELTTRALSRVKTHYSAANNARKYLHQYEELTKTA
jgi:glycosyltransferase involved in cell wall biosynthesis